MGATDKQNKVGEGPLQQGYKQLEELWISVLQRAINHQGLLGLSSRWVTAGLTGRLYAAALGEQWLRFWGVPTASQMVESLSLLQRLEDRLLRLEDQLAVQAEQDRLAAQAERRQGTADAVLPSSASTPTPADPVAALAAGGQP